MIKSTLYFGSKVFLNTKNKQLILSFSDERERQFIPIEDIGSVVIDHPAVTITTPALQLLSENKSIVIYCDDKHLPSSTLLPLVGHFTPNARARLQISELEKFQARLWKLIVKQKVKNQADLLEHYGFNSNPLKKWEKEVKAFDKLNVEAKAAKYYWSKHMSHIDDFTRNRDGVPPNNFLNFGYTILRSMTARAIISAGLLPVFGIYHHNKYNPFCLADDLMEPYRPYVDHLVFQKSINVENLSWSLTKEIKAHLLQINYINVLMENKQMPLMNALEKTCYSLVEYLERKTKKLCLPQMNFHV